MKDKRTIPKNPEKYFKATPHVLSKESEIRDLSTFEDRRGIVLDSLDEVKEAIETYVTQIRPDHEKIQDSQKVVKATFRDLENKLTHANEKAMRTKRETLNSLIKETNLLPNVTPNIKRKIFTNLGEVIDLFERCECLYEGEFVEPVLFDYLPGSLLGETKEIGIETTNHKYIVSVNRKAHNNDFNNSWFEKKLAREIGKERLIHQAGVKANLTEVDCAWYNIPFFGILEASGLRYAGERRQEIVSSSLKRIGKRKSKELGIELLQSSSSGNFLCFPYKGKRYSAFFEIENLHKSLLPDGIELNDEIDPNEKKSQRYAKIRGDNLVGPAWTIYRGKKWARVEKPVLNITLSYANKDPFYGVSVINEDEIKRLIGARDKLADNLRV